MDECGERQRIQNMLMEDAFETTYYESEALRKSAEDYYPYGYVEEEEEPVSSTGEDLLDWEWE